jgi:hypothetical protein
LVPRAFPDGDLIGLLSTRIANADQAVFFGFWLIMLSQANAFCIAIYYLRKWSCLCGVRVYKADVTDENHERRDSGV